MLDPFALANSSQDDLRKPGDETTGRSAGVADPKEMLGTPLEMEGCGGADEEAPPKEGRDPASHSPASEGQPEPLREYLPPRGSATSCKGPPHLGEDLLSIRAPNDQADEVDDLLRGNATPPSSLVLIAPDLRLDDIGEPEATGEGKGHILVLENLLRAILLAESLKEGQRDLSPHPTEAGARSLIRGVLDGERGLSHGIGQEGSEPLMSPGGPGGATIPADPVRKRAISPPWRAETLEIS